MTIRSSSTSRKELYQNLLPKVAPTPRNLPRAPSTNKGKFAKLEKQKIERKKSLASKLKKVVGFSPEFLIRYSKQLDAKEIIGILYSISELDDKYELLLGLISTRITVDIWLQIKFTPLQIVSVLEAFSKTTKLPKQRMRDRVFVLFANRISSDPKFVATFTSRDIISVANVYSKQNLMSDKLYSVLINKIEDLLPSATSNDIGILLNLCVESPFMDEVIALVGEFVTKNSVRLDLAGISAVCHFCSKLPRSANTVSLMRYIEKLLIIKPFILSKFEVKGLANILGALKTLNFKAPDILKKIVYRLSINVSLINYCDAEALSHIVHALHDSDLRVDNIFKTIAYRISNDKKILCQFTPHQLSKTLKALSSFKISFPSVYDVVRKRILQNFAFVDEFTVNDIVAVVYAFSKIEGKNLPIFELFATRILSCPGIINQFKPRTMYLFLDSYLKASVRHLVLFNYFATAIVQHPTLYKEFTPSDITNIFAVFSKLGVKNLGMYFKLTPKNSRFLSYQPAQIVVILHSLSSVCIKEHHYFRAFLDMVDSSPEYLMRFDARSLSTLLHSFSAVGRNQELYETVEGLVLKDPSILASFSPNQISVFLNSFSKKGEINSMLISLLSDRILFNEEELHQTATPQTLCMLIYDFSNLSFRNETLFKTLGDCLIKNYRNRLHEFTSLGIANILNGYHRVQIRNDELFELLLGEIVNRKDFFSLAESPKSALFKVLTAVKGAGIKSVPLLNTVNVFLDRKENKRRFKDLRNGGMSAYNLE